MSGRLLRGVIKSIHSVSGPKSGSFVTQAVDQLVLGMDGIAGERHSGLLRPAGPREPWLPRGMMLRNDRQISALSADELATIAHGLDLTELEPGLTGANIVVDGIAGFSRIAPGSLIAIGGLWGGKGLFDGEALLRVEAYNRPCRATGRKLATAHGRPELEFDFVRVARSLRGVVLSVAHPGNVRAGDPIVVMPAIVPP
jgi:hypothetical protein